MSRVSKVSVTGPLAGFACGFEAEPPSWGTRPEAPRRSCG